MSVSRLTGHILRLVVALCSSFAPLNDAKADTSELSLSVDSGVMWRSQPLGRDDGEARWVPADLGLEIAQQLSVRAGLGVSFAFEVWGRATLERLGAATLLSEEGVRCLDPALDLSSRSLDELTVDHVAQCTRSVTRRELALGLLELGTTYRPYDHWSPVVSLSLGLSYAPPHRSDEVIEGVEPDLSWRPIARGIEVPLQPMWGWRARLDLGGEARVRSRWGVRISGWGALDGDLSTLALSGGVSLSVTYYRYLRLW